MVLYNQTGGWMMIRRIFRWPASEYNDLSPWYVVARRMTFYVMFVTALCLAWFAILCGYGYKAANDWFRDAI